MVTAHSFRILFDGFLLAKAADGLSPRTLETYRLLFNNLARDFPPEKLQSVADLTPQDFQEWVIDMRKRLATATIDQRISKAKAFFNWCVREGFLESNPMGAIKRPSTCSARCTASR